MLIWTDFETTNKCICDNANGKNKQLGYAAMYTCRLIALATDRIEISGLSLTIATVYVQFTGKLFMEKYDIKLKSNFIE